MATSTLADLVKLGRLGDDSYEVAQRYIQGPEAANDAKDFDVTDILNVDSTILMPSASSPLK